MDFSNLEDSLLNTVSSGSVPTYVVISFPNIPSNAAITLLSVGIPIPASHFLMSFNNVF